MENTLRRPESCPKCSLPGVLRIHWGRPSPDAHEQVHAEIRAGLTVLGGCHQNITTDPSWQCDSCHHRWADETDPAQQELRAERLRILDRLARSRIYKTEDPIPDSLRPNYDALDPLLRRTVRWLNDRGFRVSTALNHHGPYIVIPLPDDPDPIRSWNEAGRLRNLLGALAYRPGVELRLSLYPVTRTANIVLSGVSDTNLPEEDPCP